MIPTCHLDLVGLKCPQPIIKLMLQIKSIEAGEQLSATADDPAFPLDVEAWCQKTGHELVQLERSEETISVIVRKSYE